MFRAQQQQQQAAADAAEAMQHTGTCWACRQARHLNSCSYCSRGVCDTCTRQCELCLEVFCMFCSSVRCAPLRRAAFQLNTARQPAR